MYSAGWIPKFVANSIKRSLTDWQDGVTNNCLDCHGKIRVSWSSLPDFSSSTLVFSHGWIPGVIFKGTAWAFPEATAGMDFARIHGTAFAKNPAEISEVIQGILEYIEEHLA